MSAPLTQVGTRRAREPTFYGRDFYEMQSAGSARSASIVVPIVLQMLSVQSVCDVGCGVGTWLNTFANHGIRDFLGLDGDYVEPEMLQIPRDKFQATNLEKSFRIGRTFDLAVSLEVAEHLSPARAESFVEDLTRLSSIILFSAAVPNQGGVNHINERWPSYWARIFFTHGFGVCDVVRSKIWDNGGITPCYRQNLLIFARSEIISSNPLLIESRPEQVDVAHPIFYSRLIPDSDVRLLAKHLWWAINRNLRRRLKTPRREGG
ncbi:MAG: class I SAM-dependent methyltransferase [Candidatus Acidiferrales bacterium]